eukprot:TRINITY_DN1742_c0_g1_i5.p1 TRINITY_DN1742_c0_g1~~TRINITY_DN1742_c0_g1_i5.p1  ORF type:complete len:638 (+),score=97.84 TRINITY_DN1742_c0_g1_i5:146-2059(+)
MSRTQDENMKRKLPPPPPPLKRGPPPPPPPGLGRTANTTFQDPTKCGIKLRKVHWELIPAAHVKERTIFQEIQNRLSDYQKSSDGQSLQQQFEIRDNNNSPETQSLQNSSLSGGGGGSMKLALKRAQTIEIVLKSFKMSQAQICEGVCRLTSEQGSILSDSQIQELLKCMPNEDEEKSLQAIVRKSLSGPAERFLLLLMSVPYVQERLKFGLFVGQFDEIIRGLEIQINLLNDACAEVQNSKEILLLFTVILVVGNILNEGTKFGNAKGFKISSLKQLKGTKTTVGNDKNLLHVILEQVQSESEELFCNLDYMLPSCEKASEISLKEIEQTIKNTQAYILDLQNFADRIDQIDGGRCGDKVRNFFTSAKSDIERVHSDFVQAKQDFKSLAEYLEGKVYGQGQQPTDLFYNLKMFKQDIKIAKKQIKQTNDSRDNSNIQQSPQTSEISVSTLQSVSPAVSTTTTTQNTTTKNQVDRQFFKRSDGEIINVQDLRKSIRMSMAGIGGGLPSPCWLDTEGVVRDRRFQRNIQQLSSSQSFSKSNLVSTHIDTPPQPNGGQHVRKKTTILNQINFGNLDSEYDGPRPAHSPIPQPILTTQESAAAPNKTKNNSYPNTNKSWLTKSFNVLKKNLCGFEQMDAL